MSTIFGFIFVIFIIILLIGFSLIGGILKFLFGLGRRRNTDNQYQGPFNGRTYGNNSRKEPFHSKKKSRKKVFDEDEGEYVDFEEIKNEKNR